MQEIIYGCSTLDTKDKSKSKWPDDADADGRL